MGKPSGPRKRKYRPSNPLNVGFVGAGSTTRKKHDKAYWDRLKAEFAVGEYKNSGAYGTWDNPGGIQLMDSVREKPFWELWEEEHE